MLTIIEHRKLLQVPIAGMVFVLIAWFGGVAGLALAIDPTVVVVFGPEQNLLSAVQAADASLLSVGPDFVTARAERRGFVRQLYDGGAWFVWPVVKSGCFSDRRP